MDMPVSIICFGVNLDQFGGQISKYHIEHAADYPEGIFFLPL